MGTGIKTVTIPASVTIIGTADNLTCSDNRAFDSLTSATFEDPTGWTYWEWDGDEMADDYDASESALSNTSTAATYLNQYALSKS